MVAIDLPMPYKDLRIIFTSANVLDSLMVTSIRSIKISF